MKVHGCHGKTMSFCNGNQGKPLYFENVEGKTFVLHGKPLVLHGKPMLLAVLGRETLVFCGGGLDFGENHT